ncbi:hypothetical protein HanXRQr2_Chr01g0004821 [Helianthus annuus]|uniref:Uncharacterized protein n=1 Tax=Helianthus annuus TaxID=4232 RepID=A0A9K3JT32_HELAN|nr:hypothetical protein HanXRQr2_Chr01g0004821 [Helianthus annuus]KAJ0955600.1 hypothetical protein HanPSC8_Chr01g0004681 [Helianthus annuus]
MSFLQRNTNFYETYQFKYFRSFNKLVAVSILAIKVSLRVITMADPQSSTEGMEDVEMRKECVSIEEI